MLLEKNLVQFYCIIINILLQSRKTTNPDIIQYLTVFISTEMKLLPTFKIDDKTLFTSCGVSEGYPAFEAIECEYIDHQGDCSFPSIYIQLMLLIQHYLQSIRISF